MNDQQSIEALLHKQAIEQVLYRYTRACDQRDWNLFEQVFHPDIEVNYNDEFKSRGSSEVVALIKGFLGGCGPTQHLMGNLSVTVEGNQASSSCYVRAAHAGTADREHQIYEIWAEYRSHFVLEGEQWLIDRHELWLFKETGSRDVLGPENQ